MEYNPFVHNYRFYGATDTSELPSFADTVGATLGYQYAPLLDFIANKVNYGFETDPSYVSTNDMEGYETFRDQLVHAQNAEHMQDLKNQLDANLKRRKVLAESSIGSQFFAGLFDPVNFIALPFGGAAVGVARSALRTGASVAAIQSVQEAYRYPLDPLATPAESAINIGSAFAAGSLLGGAFSVPITRRAAAISSTTEQLKRLESTLNPKADPKRPAATQERPFAQLVPDEIESIIKMSPARINASEKAIKDMRSELQLAKAELDGSTTRSDKMDAGRKVKYLESRIEGTIETLDRTQKELSFADSERIFRIKEEAETTISNPYAIAKSAWTDSVMYEGVTTPVKRTLQNKKVPDSTKLTTVKLVGDSGTLLNINRHGGKAGASVYQRAQTRNGEWVQVNDNLIGLYEREYKMGPQMFPDVDVRSKAQAIQNFTGKQVRTYQDWIADVNRKRIKNEKPTSDAEAEAMKAIEDYYTTWGERLEEVGMLGGEKYYTRQMIWIERDIARLQKEIVDLQKTVDFPEGTKISEKEMTKKQRRLFYRRQRLRALESKASSLEGEIKMLQENPIMPPNEKVFNPRYWDIEAILANKEQFFKILFDWYKKNPEVYVFEEASNKFVKKTLSTRNSAVEKRVNDTIETITQRKDALHEEQSFYGGGKSKHLRHREIDIPNELVVDFIENNPINVMKTYNQRIAPQYEFEVEFGRSIDDLLLDEDLIMVDAGMSLQERNAVLRDLRHSYERVTTKVLRDPNSWDQQTATVLKDLAMLNYLGTAGLATLPDFAKIMMEHEIGSIAKGLFGVLNDHKVRLSASEARKAGEAIEILMGDAHLRLTEYMNNNPLNTGFMNRVRSGFFMLNGLAPMTNIFKRFDAIMRGHTLIDGAMKWAKGIDADGKPATITKQEMEYLLRYNIDLEDAKKIADSPWDRTENGLYLPNTDKWADDGVRFNFRTSMNSGIMNTILMGTPADKPIAVDGVFYLPMHVAKRFNMNEDPKFRGYARMENALLGLPFQFMSYSFAAANKITASLAHDQVKNRAVAVTASLGLGYMSLSLKQPDWVMDKMSFADKFARSFDASGIASLYSDLFYTAMSTSLALGGPNIGMGIINPKFPQGQSYADAVTGIAGAGPAYAVDVTRAVSKMVTGDFDQGLYEFTGRLPFASALIWNEEVKELRQSLRGGRY